MTERRILSLDGGGVKGVFAASFLAYVEETLGIRVKDYFDLIAGSSTGGIIALGLGLGLSAGELLELYEKEGRRVFGGAGGWKWLTRVFRPKYSSAGLRAALTARLGERLLGDSGVRLVIPATNLETGEVYVFKTAHDRRFERDWREKAVDVALATSAAPMYFASHRMPSGAPLIDGGIWAMNPTGIAVVEAIAVLGWNREDLRVLSIGCTSEALDTGRLRHGGGGIWAWSLKVVDTVMAGQSSASMGIARVLAGHENVMRIDPMVAGGRFRMDDAFELASLRGLGASEGRKATGLLRKMFFSEPAEPFRPFHGAHLAQGEGVVGNQGGR